MAESSEVPVRSRACDGCHTRKVKCDFSYLGRRAVQIDRCARCLRLDLRCTFDAQPGSRGRRKGRVRPGHSESPQTRNSEQQQSQSQVSPGPANESCSIDASNTDLHYLRPASPHLSLPISPEQQFRNSLILSGIALGSGGHSAEYPTNDICSRNLMTLILDDYLRLIYPLVPVVHRPSFIRDFHSARDVVDKDFHSLIVSLSAVVASTLPKRFKIYKTYHHPLRFRSRAEMLNHCYIVIMSNRAPDYFDRINHCKWAIAYLMRIAFYQSGQHNRSRMMDVEAMQLARLLYFHQVSEYKGLNCIETQLRKKAFWLGFYSYVHNQLQSLRSERLTYIDPDILDTIKLEDLLPAEVDDEMIFEDKYGPQPSAVPCVTAGFVIHSRVFWAALKSTQPTSPHSHSEELCRCHRAKYPLEQITHLRTRLRELKYMLDRTIPQLRQWVPLSNGSSWDGQSDKNAVVDMQFAVMRGNLHSTHIWIQSILLDQLGALLHKEAATSTSHSPSDEKVAIWAQREELSRQLLALLHAIPLQHLEPNGLNLTEKIRDVAVSLLSCPYPPEDEPAKRAVEYVREFTEIIARFELDPVFTSNTQSWTDTDRAKGPSHLAGSSSTGHNT